MSEKFKTPLRYPGGKAILSDFLARCIDNLPGKSKTYVEPYCGGAGSAVALLERNDVSQVWLNDANFQIYSFWFSMKYMSDDFLEKLETTPVSLPEWKRQRERFKKKIIGSPNIKDILEVGFATFYLNRCNRSGILHAGPIGGQTIEGQENAIYKIDARFNKKSLIERIKLIKSKAEKLEVHNKDAIKFLEYFESRVPKPSQKQSLVYLDPPYYIQGSGLYMNHYKKDDHASIAKFLSKRHLWHWLLSYDRVPEIENYYKKFKQYRFFINYSAQISKLGQEVLIQGPNTILPESLLIRQLSKSKKKISLEPINPLPHPH